MKVAIIVPIVGNFGRKGFYHSQEIGLGKEIASHGNEVTVYKCVSVNSMEGIQTDQLDGITIKYIPTRALGPHGMLNTDLIASDSDIAFTFSDTQFIIPKLYRYCKKNGIKFIPYIGIAHSFQQNLKSKLMDIIFKLTTLNVYKKTTVIAKTIDAKKELASLGVKRCVVAPVGMDFDTLKQDYEIFDRTEIRKKWGFKASDVIISFVARMQPEKHPLDMLDIFTKVQCQGRRLLMVGKGPLEEKLHEKVQKLGIENQVTFLSEVKYEEMWQIHYIADYFVNLRPEEIFGMSIMEAVYYKSCVIALSAPGPNTILKEMAGHYLCYNYENIIKTINQNNIDNDAISKSAKNLKKKFSWETCYCQIKDIAERD